MDIMELKVLHMHILHSFSVILCSFAFLLLLSPYCFPLTAFLLHSTLLPIMPAQTRNKKTQREFFCYSTIKKPSAQKATKATTKAGGGSAKLTSKSQSSTAQPASTASSAKQAAKLHKEQQKQQSEAEEARKAGTSTTDWSS
jgi:hypothetical protein